MCANLFTKVFVEDGASDIPVGKPLAIIVEEEGDIAAFQDYVPAEGPPDITPPPLTEPTDPTPTPTPAAQPATPPQTTTEPVAKPPTRATTDRIAASPWHA